MKDRGADRRVPSLVGMTKEVAARLRQSERLRRNRAHGGLLPECVGTNIEHTRNPGKTFFAFFRGGGGTPGYSLTLPRSDPPAGGAALDVPRVEGSLETTDRFIWRSMASAS